jgi:pre-mRNA-splicing helicase BRR2
MWRSQSPLRQFEGGILEDILVRLERRDFPWDRMWDLNSQEIGELIRLPAKGKDVHRLVHMFPTLRLTAHVQPITRSTLRVELTITPDFNWSDKYHGSSVGFWITVEDGDAEVILYNQYFLLKKKFATTEDNDHLVEFHVPLLDPLPPQYFVKVFSDRWLGSETVLPIALTNIIVPAKGKNNTFFLCLISSHTFFPAPSHDDMLDLRPMSVSALEKKEYIGLFEESTFNPLQTQTFNALYKSDGNVLVAASTGSGVEVCGELAILRALQQRDGKGKIVYVCPIPGLCALRKRQWEARFGVPLEKLVLELTGDTVTDLKLLEIGDIIISTPESWDRISRRWKKRKPVQDIDLFLVDQLHLLNALHGHILEVVVSRMRFISARLEKPIRIVALSASLANARDVGEWIGASKAHTFNFHPTVRPVTLEMHLQGFDSVHFAPRLASMARPMVQTIQRTPVDKPIMIFVHGRSQALSVAKDLKQMCDGLPDPAGRFRLVAKEELERLVEQGGAIKTSVHVAFLVEYGIAIYHENMSAAERDFIEKIYSLNLISCVICSRETCWSIPFRAYLVIIAGTELVFYCFLFAFPQKKKKKKIDRYYDGKEHRYIEYAIPDVLQMVGMAGRPGLDNRGSCMLFTYAPRKEFYKRYLFEGERKTVLSHVFEFSHSFPPPPPP